MLYEVIVSYPSEQEDSNNRDDHDSDRTLSTIRHLTRRDITESAEVNTLINARR